MDSSYVIQTTQGGYRVAGTRVSLDSVIHAWWEGKSAESINADFPSLTLEQVHGAIAFYLSNRKQIDQYLAQQDDHWHEFQRQSAERMAPLIERMRARAGLASETAK